MAFSFSKEFSDNSYLNIENLFISEYLPVSTGDAVKVYLYCLYLCSNKKDEDLSAIAKALDLTENTVFDSLKYWEEFGLVSVLSREPLSVLFLPVRANAGGKLRKYKPEKYTDFTKSVQSLFPSRMISTSEYTEYFNTMESYSIKPNAMLMIVKYCIDKKGDGISYKYITKVAKDFAGRGINTEETIEKELFTFNLRNGILEKIFKALKISRQPDYEDQNYLNKWTNELTFEENNIIFASKLLKKGNMEKLDSFLMELYSMKSFSEKEISDYFNNKQRLTDMTIKINKALSIYVEVIETEIDNYVNKWISFGYTEETLLIIASFCFRQGKNNLADMDDLIESLRKEGYIDLTSVGDHFESIQKTENFIRKMLGQAGINRRPTPWDIENIKMWKSWNFSDDMIIEASKLASGKSSPIAYMNGILSNWKNKGIFTLEKIDKDDDQNNFDSPVNYNKEYERRRGIAISRAQKNTEKAMEIPDFSATYERFLSIERDLAFAEIANEKETLTKLENEKTSLKEKISSLLKTVNLELDDLSPKYACQKCNDTGYIGTHRCDCLNKKV